MNLGEWVHRAIKCDDCEPENPNLRTHEIINNYIKR